MGKKNKNYDDDMTYSMTDEGRQYLVNLLEKTEITEEEEDQMKILFVMAGLRAQEGVLALLKSRNYPESRLTMLSEIHERCKFYETQATSGLN